MSNFVHLHGHTEYSLLDGLSKVKKLVKAVKDMEMPAVAMTDHGVMYGAIEFYKTCIDVGIKPIIGCEFYIAKRSHKDKEGKLDTEPFHLTVLAKNYQGYLNLMKLVSIAHLDGYYYKPRVDRELLKEFHEGLMVLSGCPGGELIKSLKDDNSKDAEEIVKAYIDIFGEENYYLELQNHEYENLLKDTTLDPKVRRDLENMSQIQTLSWKAIKGLSSKFGLPMVATNDYHYVSLDDAQAQDAVLCVQTGRFVKDIDRLRMIDIPNLYIRSSDEMSQLFSEIPEAITNTVKIAEKVDLEIPLGKASFPIFDIPGGKTPMEYLRELTFERGKDRIEMTEEAIERLNYELGIIEKKNYPTYFLVVQDFVNFANEQGIITNTRGSAAGSLVLFALGVTKINPLLYRIPFERFLNPERPSLPDIDTDLADDRRDEVIRYVMEKYGHDKVAHIVTFGTMMGRAAIRDIGRVLAMPYGDVDRIAKLVPPPKQGFHQTLSDALKEVPELGLMYKNDPQVKTLIDLAKKVEGTVRHASVHAAGVVIAPQELTNFTPIQRESNGDKIVTQYEMHAAEDVGLVKLDFLGIRNLSILGRAVEYVEKNRGLKIDLDKIPLDDEKTYELLGRGETMGVFQLGSSGMTKWLMDLQPKVITDISAMVALYRPGPMGSIPDYIERAHNPKKIAYFDPRMEEYMEQSLGLLVYQEDVLLTAINIAGYSWLEADTFRKAMGKKIPAEMAKQKDKFISGAIEQGMAEKKALELWALIEPFAAYGFPKAHAASYAIVSYQTAYMKANFPVEYMAAVMTAEYGDMEKIAEAIEECKKMGIYVLPPDVNRSGVGFTIEDLSLLSEEDLSRRISGVEGRFHKEGIRFGLSAIKNVGVSAIESIIKARGQVGFKSLPDLCSKVDNRLVNKKTLESLIKVGALDRLGSRAAQLLILDACLEKAHQQNKNSSSGQVGLFGEEENINEIIIKLPDVEELGLDQMLIFEKELLGFYLHEPPFLALLKQVGDFCTRNISDITEDNVGQKVVLGGVLTEIKKVVTKKSQVEMAFIKLSDGVLAIEGVVFPKIFNTSKGFLEKDKVILAWGKIDKREDQLSLVVDRLEEFNPATAEVVSVIVKEVEIMVPKSSGVEVLQQVNKTLREHPGKYKVSILLSNGGNELKCINLPFGVSFEPLLIDAIEGILGKGTVRLT